MGYFDIQEAGIIPANTGRINVGIGSDKLDEDHPREYGENTC